MLETIAGVSVIAVVIGLTEIAKKYINERYIPIVPFILSALILSLGFASQEVFTIAEYVMTSLMFGLMANGLYSGVKKVVKG